MENYIFNFNDSPALRVQDVGVCDHLYDDFWKRILESDEKYSLPKKELQDVKASCSKFHWKPTYASVIVVRPLDTLTSTITLVGLDGWKSAVHAFDKGRESIALSDICTPAIFECGSMQNDQLDELFNKVAKVLYDSECNNTGNKRGQGPGHQGNQKTPTFLRNLLWQEMNSTKPQTIQGGTTDVGLHTGCIPRNTSFPLVLSSFCWNLQVEGEESHQLFYRCACVFFLTYLEGIAPTISDYDARKIDRVIYVIREIELYLPLVDDSKFADTVLMAVEFHYGRMLDLRPGSAVKHERKDLIVGSVPELCETMTAPPFPKIPDLKRNDNHSSRMAQARADARINLDWSNLDSLEYTGKLQDACVQIAALNKYFWKIALDLNDDLPVSSFPVIADLRSKLQRFSQQIKLAYWNSLSNPHVMSVLYSSYEVLAYWICFCWAHRTAEEVHPIYHSFGSALNPEDLVHIALDDKRGIEALACVRQFLNPRFERSCKPFRIAGDTLHFARTFGSSSQSYNNIYQRELNEANRLIQDRWNQIRETQRQLSLLDSQLKQAAADLQRAETQLRQSRGRDFDVDYCGNKIYQPIYYTYQTHRNNYQVKVSGLKSKIEALETKPCNLLLGLPRNQTLACQWLFFLFMPIEFIDLAFLAQSAQAMLWVKSPTGKSPTQDMISWYNQYRKIKSHCTCVAKAYLGSESNPPRIDTPNIRKYSRETGVFFPDYFPLQAYWSTIDPFASGRSNDDTAKLFTEKLPIGVDRANFMQDFVTMLPSKSRENKGVANRDKKPSWLNQEQYLAFTTLRAGPFCQIRCLVDVLQDDLLPFHDDCVHILIKQLLFHVGEESWKGDLTNSFEGYSLLSYLMNEKMDILQESPKDSDKLLLFGLICSFIGQFHYGCHPIALGCSTIFRRWAEDVDNEVKVHEIVPQKLYWKQAKWFGCSLICKSLGNLNGQGLLQIAELIVLYRNKKIFASGAERSCHFEQLILDVMASRITDIIAEVENNLYHLTRCLSLIIDDVPRTLQWRSIIYDNHPKTASFEAEDDHLYSINLLNGTILVDGVPPGLLPSSVINDSLYVRTFGPRNFEVVVLGPQHFRTARRVHNDTVLYEFMFDSKSRLQIVEKQETNSGYFESLLLIRREEVILPIHLRECYSHWLSTDHKAVFLRKPFYTDRAIEYLISKKNTYEIHFTNQLLPIQAILQVLPKSSRLLMGLPEQLCLLTKFESHDFIHFMVNPEKDEMKIILVRFNISFLVKNSIISSVNFSGFRVQDKFVLDDTIPGHDAFLALSNADGTKKVLFREGEVRSKAQVYTSDDWTLSARFHICDVHSRFHHLMPLTLPGRLHLAALYASNACAISDRRIDKPGAVFAIDLLRHSWQNEPFSEFERSKLMQVVNHSNLSCTLRLMCSWLWKCSNQVYFLHEKSKPNQIPELELDALALDEYRRNKHSTPLLPWEESSLLGTKPKFLNISSIETASDSKVLTFVRKCESGLRDQFLHTERSKVSRLFPLRRPATCKGLEHKLWDDLESSYEIFSKQRVTKIKIPVDIEVVSDLATKTRERRQAMEQTILGRFNGGDGSCRDRLSRCSGQKLSTNTLDLLRFIADGDPYHFPRESTDIKLRQECVDWAVLCVFEDKLQRMMGFNRLDDQRSFLTEIQSIRTWNATKYTRWLAFEVEQQIQIRPNQVTIVKQLLEKPGSAVQLNMGLGKTRVLVPMLIMYYVSVDKIPRINVLPAILHEAISYYRRILVASVQNIKLFSLPFHRQIYLDKVIADHLQDHVNTCFSHKGFFVTTPQHRNSLLLKQHDQGVFLRKFEDQFKDILDESDALLSHDFQLVYALGTQEPLPSGPCRWTVLQALLVTLSRCEDDDITSFTRNPVLVHREEDHFGAFPNLRLLLPFQGSERELGIRLCRQLVRNPPHVLRWMKEIDDNDIDLLVSIMSDSSLKDVLSKIDLNLLFREKKSEVLAARGFIAFGLLLHGMKARYRVNYGLNNVLDTKMAVPYSACDTPKGRAQYSHPDMELVYTVLSYFQRGLTKIEVKKALEHLQTMGPEAQFKIYKEWIDSIADDVPTEQLIKFDNILKVDVSNEPLLEILYKNLHRSMDVITFWMNFFVLETDTDLFSKRRATSAWQVSASGIADGFSGTNDNSPLLPLSITQRIAADDMLKGTNGSMIRCIIDQTKEVVLLPEARDVPVWKVVVDQCNLYSLQALIDVGGLMAGTTNKEVAMLLSKTGTYRGVTYFDAEADTWMVYEKETHRLELSSTSSLTESECFVYFDESRCRGTDKKLAIDAAALVTLEPKLTKDKFLQGCARMRKLFPGGQSLILAGTAEVISADSTSRDVLEKIMHHTAATIARSIPTYYQHGRNFYSFPDPIQDDFTLESMYGRILHEYGDFRSMLDAIQETEDISEDVEELIDYCCDLGREVRAVDTGRMTEECEQEMEEEVEHEEEQEVEIPAQLPHTQEDWDFPRVFLKPDDNYFSSLFITLRNFVGTHLKSIAGIEWGESIFCTPNFWKTIAGNHNDLSLYLRQVHSILYIPNQHRGRIILISNYELDKLLPIWWNQAGRKPKAFLLQLSLCEKAHGFGYDDITVPNSILALVKLFRGYVKYTDEQKDVIGDALTGVSESHLIIHDLLRIRSRVSYLDRSDLADVVSGSGLRRLVDQARAS